MKSTEFTPEQIQVLTAMGDYLDSMTEDLSEQWARNESGFNMIDKARYAMMRGHAPMMARMLKKYQRQLSAAFDAEALAVLQLAPEHPTVYPEVRDTQYGPTCFLRVNFIPREDFQRFLQTVKGAGLRFDGQSKQWFVASKDMKTFDFETLWKQLVSLNLEVAPAGKEGVHQAQLSAAVQTTPRSIQDAVRLIEIKQLHNVITLRRLPTGKFEFRFPFSKTLNELFSNKTGKLTRITEYNPATHARETYQIELVIEAVSKIEQMIASNELPGWTLMVEGLEQAKAEFERQKELLKEQLPEVSAVIDPAFTLFAHQNEAIKFLVKNNGNALLGFDVGTGKTLMSLAYIAAFGKRALVVAPKVVRRNWINEAKRFFPSYFHEFSVLELDTKMLRKNGQPDLSQVRLASLNYESLSKFLPAIEAAGFDVLVCDESHKIKDEKTLTSQLVSQIAKFFKHKILLSGTAVKNKKEELYPQLELVSPGLFESRKQIRELPIGTVWNMMQRCYMSKTKAEVLKDLPDKITQVISVPCGEKLPDYDPSKTLQIEDIARLKNAVAIGKASASADFIAELLEDSDSSILVFTDSREAAQTIYEKLGSENAVLHHGQMSQEVRERMKQEWQAMQLPQRVFIATRQSLPLGATLTRADKVVFSDLPYTASDVIQAEARAYRIGTTSTVNVYWLYAQDNNWDEKVSQIVKQKYDLCKKANEGKQLTPEEREWMNKEISLEDFRSLPKGKKES